MLKLALAILCPIAAFPTPANAQFENISQDGDCTIAASFEGPGSPSLAFVARDKEMVNNQFGISVKNENWSLKNEDPVSGIVLRTADRSFTDADYIGITNGFIGLFSQDDLSDLISGPAIQIFRKGTLIAGFNFSYSDTNAFRTCVLAKRAAINEAKAKAEHEKALESLPHDPFAPKR